MQLDLLSKVSLLPLFGLSVQLFSSLCVYLLAQPFFRTLMKRVGVASMHSFFKLLVDMLPMAFASCSANLFSIVAEPYEFGYLMPYGTALLWLLFVYMFVARLMRLFLPIEIATQYELMLWLPVMVLMSLLYFVGALPKLFELLSHPLLRIGKNEIPVSSLIIAVAVSIVAIWFSNVVSNSVHKSALMRYEIDEHIAYILSQSLRVGILVVGMFFVIDTLGIDLSSLKFFAGGFGVALGFGMQQIANNFISGMLLIIERSVRIGDVISVAGQLGRVERITARSTTICTPDDKHIIIPNMHLLTMPVMRIAKDSPFCIQLSISTAHPDDLDKLQALLLRAVSEHPRVAKEPAPELRLTKFSSDAVSFELSVWVEAIGKDALRVESELYRRLFEAVKSSGVGIK
ncbi:MAG: hypothetical protein RUDDFDWM_000399 [Candidatus Fervidibacterota bacterium]